MHHFERSEWIELALLRNGFTSQRLMLLSHKITSDYIAGNIPYLEQSRRADLADFVLEKSLPAVLRFRPDHPTKTYSSAAHFSSWMSDLMMHRCTDWFRSRAEGNGDARYGHHNRVVLTDSFDDDADPEIDFEKLLSERRLVKWQQAAEAVNLSLADYIAVTLDRASAQTLKTAPVSTETN
jgi:hypothetical protein